MGSNYDEIVKFLLSKIKVKSFKDDLENKLYFYDDTKLKLKIQKNKIFYVLNEYGKIITSEYIIKDKNIIVKYSETEYRKVDCKKFITHDINETKVFKLYNQNGIETFNKEIRNCENYCIDKKTNNKTINDINKNYSLKKYQWRIDSDLDNYDLILKKEINQYYDSQKNLDDCTLRDQLVNKEEQEIPDYGLYYNIDNDTFFECIKEETKTTDLKKYKKK